MTCMLSGGDGVQIIRNIVASLQRSMSSVEMTETRYPLATALSITLMMTEEIEPSLASTRPLRFTPGRRECRHQYVSDI